jgi:DNA-binding transcriptional regulator YiaG
MSPEEIRKLRDALGLTQAAFAERIGAQRVTIARWEIGVSQPKGLYLQALEKLQDKAKAVKKKKN